MKVSVSIPDELMAEVSREMQETGKRRSAVFAEALRARFGPGYADRGNIVSREEFDEVAGIVNDLRRLAERSGAV